jgi:hypothetical protein
MHKNIISIYTAVFATLSLPLLTQAATDPERLEILERRLDALTQSRPATDLQERLQLHGYGELHYNDLSGRGGASDEGELDFHRFVLFLGYDFNDRIRFHSELELEHALAGDGKPGEVELEQAYVDIDLTEDHNHTARAGLFLVPVGLLNPTHEPPRFYGVERNSVEKNIIPTTWWEGGLGLHGELGAGWQYETAVHSGLNTSTGSTYAVRSGRQKVAKATASDPAATLALSWNAPGVTLGGAVQYQSDMTQGSDASAGSAWLGELHASVQRGPLGLRALYAEWALNGNGPESMGADRQYGWYVEPSYRITDRVGVFARYSEWDNQAGSGASDSGKAQIDTGVNWWPHEQVVFKADYQWQDNDNGKEQNGVNLGVGYEF